MADQQNRGVSKVLAGIVGAMKPYEQITSNDAVLREVQKDIPKATEQSIMSGLCYLRDKGVLVPTAVKGVYSKPNGKARSELPTDMETVVIDNLLNAMAEAEPVLKRCKKMLEAFRAVG